MKVDATLETNYSRWLPADINAPILDLGCGEGRFLRFLVNKGYQKVLGVDRDPASLSLVGEIPGVSIECAEVDCDYLENMKCKFQLIVLKQVIYYIERRDIVKFMKALREALADDGVIIVEFFNGILLSSRLTELKDPFIFTSYTEHSIKRVFHATGFEVIRIFGETRKPLKVRSYIYIFFRWIWVKLLMVIFILERGLDNELPVIFQKSIIAVAKKS